MKNFSLLSIVFSIMTTCLTTVKAERMESPEVLNRHQNMIKLIADRACPGCDLIGMDLSGIDLNSVDLTGANLSGSNLSGSNLSHANLESANLSYTNLTEVDFNYTNISYAKMHGVRMKNVKNLHSVKGIFKRIKMVSHDAYQRYVSGN